MRHIGYTTFALLLLVRCGAPTLPVRAPEAEPQVAHAAEPVVVPVAEIAPAPIPSAERDLPYESVRETVGRLSIVGCGGGLVIDEKTGKAINEPERWKITKELGEPAFPHYERILTDRNSSWGEINGTCEIICALGAGPRFVPRLIQRLEAPDALVPGDATEDGTRRLVRRSVISALDEIGERRHLGCLVRLLYQGDRNQYRDVGEALAKLGDQRELEAMDAWLAEQNSLDPYVMKVRKFRDELEARLLAEPTPRGF